MEDIDWNFISLSILLFILIFLDASLTAVGINLGYKEGNKIILFFMNMFGMYPTLIGAVLISFLVIIALIYVRHKLNKKWLNKVIDILLITAIVFRTFVVGWWYGLISAIL